MSALDLFGQEIATAEPLPPGVDKRRKTVPKGYAATPGGGPKGETCKTCEHYAHRSFAKTYRKCGLLRAVWTNGPGTDILARSPACQLWEPRKEPKP